MNKLFEFALQVGKRVRTETEISHGAVSHSLAAIETIEDEQIDLNNAHITIIGVNKLTADILKFLKNKGAKTVFLANRSQEKAHQLADPLGIPVVSLSEKDVPGWCRSLQLRGIELPEDVREEALLIVKERRATKSI